MIAKNMKNRQSERAKTALFLWDTIAGYNHGIKINASECFRASESIQPKERLLHVFAYNLYWCLFLEFSTENTHSLLTYFDYLKKK